MIDLCTVWLELQVTVLYPILGVVATAGLVISALAQFGAIIHEAWAAKAKMIFPHYLKGFLLLIIGPVVLGQLFALIGIPVCGG